MSFTQDLSKFAARKIVAPIGNTIYSVLDEYGRSGTLTERIDRVRSIHATQGSSGNWNYNAYMHGLFNGLELAMMTLENREPEFRDAPEEWLCDHGKPVPAAASDTDLSHREMLVERAESKRNFTEPVVEDWSEEKDAEEARMTEAVPADDWEDALAVDDVILTSPTPKKPEPKKAMKRLVKDSF
jgi:hypothetical protein